MAGYSGTATRGDLTEALRAMIEAEVNDRQTAARGKIVSYDPAKQVATIKPLMKVKIGQKDYEAPDLLEVPVRQPRGGGAAVHVPLKPGDEVSLVAMSRPLDKAQTDGEVTHAGNGRRQDISDFEAWPAGSSDKKPLKNMPTDGIHIGPEDASKGGLKIKDDGSFELSKGGDSLLSVLRDFLKSYQNHTNLGAPNDMAGEAAALIARLDKMKAT